MKLFPPQEEITLYETGFPEDDILERRHVGEQLSDLLEKIEDPLVVALDGPWGCGKTYFLKRWVGAHTLQNGGKATTIYFDAFANDFLDDPLIALIGAIGDRLPKNEDGVDGVTLKKVAVKLATPAARIGLSLAIAWISALAGPVLGAALAAGGTEAGKAIDAFWEREDERKKAMAQFREDLIELTKESKEGANDGKPLIIVVDELDRCRPDYALSILEVIKHFFSVPHVHFVLGVNLKALEHSVKARYGSEINASDYLKRFISLSMVLPNFVFHGEKRHASVEYFSHCRKKMNIDEKISSETRKHLILISSKNSISLRDIDRILTRIALIPANNHLISDGYGYLTITISLIILQILDKNLYEIAVNRNVTIEEISGFYGNKELNDIDNTHINNMDQRIINHIISVWSEFITGNSEDETYTDMNIGHFRRVKFQDIDLVLEIINKELLTVFSVND